MTLCQQALFLRGIIFVQWLVLKSVFRSVFERLSKMTQTLHYYYSTGINCRFYLLLLPQEHDKHRCDIFILPVRIVVAPVKIYEEAHNTLIMCLEKWNLRPCFRFHSIFLGLLPAPTKKNSLETVFSATLPIIRTNVVIGNLSRGTFLL